MSDPAPVPFIPWLSGVRRVVEVAAGERFDTALAVARACPRTEVVVTDINPRVLRAPAPLGAALDDLSSPDPGLYEGAGFVYAVRLPEELQGALLKLARRMGVPVAVRALKDEWAEVEGFGQGRMLPGEWRLWEPPA